MSGWIKLHRSVKDSDIYVMPPLYLRVFERLIIEANHQDKEIPFKYSGSDVATKKLIKRGERLTSIRSISEWVGWYERGIFKKPNSKTVKEILDWLVENKMIELYPNQSNRDGTHYNIVNYNDYQNTDDVEVTVKKQSGNSKETVTGSKQECIKNYKELYKDIVEYLNLKTSKRFSYTTKPTTAKINARLEEGFTLDDFKKVIDIKVSEWLSDADMHKYLRPETLFGNKFESYLYQGMEAKEVIEAKDNTPKNWRGSDKRL